MLDLQFQTRFGTDSEAVALAAANIIDGFYAAQLDTRVHLDGIVRMTDDGGLINDQGNPTTAAGALLGQFRQYTMRENVPYKDGIRLLSGRDFDGAVVGMAFSGAMCDFTHSAGVAQATSGGANAAIILAHELGHTAGLAHDSSAMGTACPAWGYIIGGMTSSADSFSPCSIDQYHAWIASHNHACMLPVAMFSDGFDDANR